MFKKSSVLKLSIATIVSFILNTMIATALEVPNQIKNVIFSIFANFANLPIENKAAYIKFFIWVAVFAVMYYVLRMAFKENTKIAVVVSIVISLLATILIPTSLVIAIATTYSLLMGIILALLPIFGGLFLSKELFEGEERTDHIGRAVIYFLIFWITGSIDETILKSPLNEWYTPISGWVGLATAIILIMAIWNVIKAIVSGGAAAAETTIGAAGAGYGKFGDWRKRFKDWGKARRTAKKEERLGMEEISVLKYLRSDIIGGRYDGAKKRIPKARKILRREKNLLSKEEAILEKYKGTEVEKELVHDNKTLYDWFRELDEFINKIEQNLNSKNYQDAKNNIEVVYGKIAPAIWYLQKKMEELETNESAKMEAQQKK